VNSVVQLRRAKNWDHGILAPNEQSSKSSKLRNILGDFTQNINQIFIFIQH
jgi:hypothetical protein